MSRPPEETPDGNGSLDLRSLYDQHSRALLLFLTRRTADPEIALDLFSETFAQALLKRDSFRGSSAAEAGGWLYAIARNELSKYYRRGDVEQRAVERLAFQRPPASPDTLEDLAVRASLAELRQVVRGSLEQLTPAVREAVELRVVAELDYRTIATRLKVSEGTARVRVSRGLAKLEEILEPEMLQVGAD